jgi:hypothetical protein
VNLTKSALKYQGFINGMSEKGRLREQEGEVTQQFPLHDLQELIHELNLDINHLKVKVVNEGLEVIAEKDCMVTNGVENKGKVPLRLQTKKKRKKEKKRKKRKGMKERRRKNNCPPRKQDS